LPSLFSQYNRYLDNEASLTTEGKDGDKQVSEKYSDKNYSLHTHFTNIYLLSWMLSLLEAGRLYRVPANVYDDYHWILSSISEQRASRKGVDLDVQANDPQGRWPGTRPMIITNDQLKDLKIEMMEPRLFRRWFSSHIVNYTFTAFVDDECADDDICFSPADFFSREIQNDTTSDGTVWHIPVSDWSLNDRLCIRLPRL
jgi:hypothetical protein